MNGYLRETEEDGNPVVKCIKYHTPEGQTMVTLKEEEINERIKEKFKATFYNENLMEGDLEAFVPNHLFDTKSVKSAAKLIQAKKALGRDYWSVKLM
jgi:hypothetical protein